jgi:hypothetical protein
MKTLANYGLVGLIALLSVTACKGPPPRAGAEPIEIFNGKDLHRWRYVLADPKVKMDAVWRIQDGLLICKGEPMGFIYTGRPLANFRLVVEYRWAPGSKPGNSGIFSRLNEKFSAIPRCVETQLHHGDAGDILTLQGMKLATNQPRYFFVAKHPQAGDICGVKKLEDKEAPPGEWNRVEILAQDSQYTVWMNGQKINEAEGVEVVAGSLGLQSEGGEIHFRRMSLTPMP